ncbi:MAG: hypothetical protein VKK42_11565 [Lyngbya sp.]|nr:hypothetical protein [Lyngbya sp.]
MNWLRIRDLTADLITACFPMELAKPGKLQALGDWLEKFSPTLWETYILRDCYLKYD